MTAGETRTPARLSVWAERGVSHISCHSRHVSGRIYQQLFDFFCLQCSAELFAAYFLRGFHPSLPGLSLLYLSHPSPTLPLLLSASSFDDFLYISPVNVKLYPELSLSLNSVFGIYALYGLVQYLQPR